MITIIVWWDNIQCLGRYLYLQSGVGGGAFRNGPASYPKTPQTQRGLTKEGVSNYLKSNLIEERTGRTNYTPLLDTNIYPKEHLSNRIPVPQFEDSAPRSMVKMQTDFFLVAVLTVGPIPDFFVFFSHPPSPVFSPLGPWGRRSKTSQTSSARS